MTAMTTGFAGLDGQPTEQIMDYYEERAKGGVGLIVSEIFCLNKEHGVSLPRQMYALNPMHIHPLAEVAARIHRYGAKIFAQLNHGGSTLNPANNNGNLFAPSAIPNATGLMPTALTLEQIEELKQQFIMSAVMLKAAGWDGVEIHGAHGYLLCEFFSPSSNVRTDQYGGSRENRVRFATEIIAGIKAVCGPDFPVAVRLSAQEYDPDHEGSITLEEGVEIAKLLEAAGADAIDVSCGNYFTKFGESMEPYSFEQGWKKGNAKAIREAVNIPVIAVNNIKEPEVAEALMEEGVCDFVGIGRGNIADPEWVRKAKEGRSNEIRKCLGCMYCFESLTTLGFARCSVNPKMSHEHSYKAPPDVNGNGRKVVVIGGGLAGMQSASLLAQRGFAVTLLEKNNELGGALNLADKTAPYKAKLTWLRDTMALECKKAGVDIRLNTVATVESVKELNPDAVFLCAGATPVCPALPGLDGDNVVLANDVISGKAAVSGKVAVIGSGLTGLETAELISNNDAVEKIYIADMVPQLGTGIYPAVFVDVVRHIKKDPVMMPGHKLDSVSGGKVKLIKVDDNTVVELDVDTVVLAMGLKPDTAVVQKFEEAFERVVVLGENLKAPGRIATSISDAYIAAYSFDPEV